MRTNIASLHSRPFVHGEEPHPTRGDPVCAKYSGSEGVNLEKQLPILRCERRAYRMDGSGRVCRKRRALGYQATSQMYLALPHMGGSAWWT